MEFGLGPKKFGDMLKKLGISPPPLSVGGSLADGTGGGAGGGAGTFREPPECGADGKG
jgi:hypothetical protein